MAEEHKGIRLKKAATELNVGISTLVEFLAKKGHVVETIRTRALLLTSTSWWQPRSRPREL